MIIPELQILLSSKSVFKLCPLSLLTVGLYLSLDWVLFALGVISPNYPCIVIRLTREEPRGVVGGSRSGTHD